MTTTLKGRTALVTGSTGGLGFAIAEGLARAGCNVVLNGIEPEERVEEKWRGLAEAVEAAVIYRRANLADRHEVAALIEASVARFGAVDILVNNAVVRHFAPIDEFPVEHWDEALAVNLSAAFHAIRLLLPAMRARNFGRIFNMSSVYGSRGIANRIDYVTTKSALLGMTRAVAMETLDFDVTCHAICPGSVLTPGTELRVRQLMDEQGLGREAAQEAFLRGKQPTGRFVMPDSVTDLLIFLCGPAARDMTGAMLPVEAGWLAS